MPLLQQRWPHFPKQRPAAPHFVLNKESLDELLADNLARCQTSQGTLQISQC
ncbi:hypothetical protein ACLB1T_18075 [Escherichia coli]